METEASLCEVLNATVICGHGYTDQNEAPRARIGGGDGSSGGGEMR